MNHLTEDQLNEYLDGLLEAQLHEQMQAHLSDCAACRAKLASLQTVFKALAGLPELTPEHNLTPSVLKILPKGNSDLGWRLALAVQAGVNLGLLLLFAPFMTDRLVQIVQGLADRIAGAEIIRPISLEHIFRPPIVLLPHSLFLSAHLPQVQVTLPVAITQSNFPIWLILGIAAILLFVIGNFSLIFNGSSRPKK